MLHMNEALLGAPYVPRLSQFKPFDVPISEGSHVSVVISFKATFSIPRDRAPRTPGLRPCVFHLAGRSCHDFTSDYAQISREKKNFRSFIWFELIK